MDMKTSIVVLIALALMAGKALGQERSTEERLRELEEVVQELETALEETQDQAKAAGPGTTTPLTSGNVKIAFVDKEGKDSTTSVVFSPHFFWRFGDRGFFESHIDFVPANTNGGEAKVNLEFANFSYIVSDYVMVEVGKFLTPFGYFQENVHTAWMNKLPDEPLPVANAGLTPTSSVGVQLRGAAPLALGVVKYALYLSNGPRLNTVNGKLEFGNLTIGDTNNNKAVGARLALMPGFLPAGEIGLSFMTGQLDRRDELVPETGMSLWGFDLNFVDTVDIVKGNIDVKAEWIFSEVDTVDFSLTKSGTVGAFTNKRDGSYVQIAYRPSETDVAFIKKTEAVVRYDVLNLPSGAPDFDESRFTYGLNYWFSPSRVLKAAYQNATKERADGSEADTVAYFLQAAIGF